MKVNIGPYTKWVGPYQIADKLKFFGFSEEYCDKVGDLLSKTYLKNICEWIESKKRRKIKVKIHDYDVWSLDSTLALIILPALKKLKELKHGVPFIDDEDVPEDLKGEDNHFKKWDYIINEMIFSFESKFDNWQDKFISGNRDFYFEKIRNTDYSEIKLGPKDTYKIDLEGIKEYQKRITKGFKLFGKYYEALWD